MFFFSFSRGFPITMSQLLYIDLTLLFSIKYDDDDDGDDGDDGGDDDDGDVVVIVVVVVVVLTSIGIQLDRWCQVWLRFASGR